jgi:hypothetical protein
MRLWIRGYGYAAMATRLWLRGYTRRLLRRCYYYGLGLQVLVYAGFGTGALSWFDVWSCTMRPPRSSCFCICCCCFGDIFWNCWGDLQTGQDGARRGETEHDDAYDQI